ncbi:MAG TPA: hypothetical protein VMW35_15700 [Myxococcota bacterium]|jgi:hypothetical protein|nr:hypothetical protein [Myxococcota bacterium]
MKIVDAVLWLRHHPYVVHGDVDAFLSRCERDLRLHSSEDAWRLAKELAEARAHEWHERVGYHASEDAVAQEICPDFARELRRLEPRLEGRHAEDLLDPGLWEQIEPEGRAALRDFARSIADDARHRAWREVVRFTRHRGTTLDREGKLRHGHDWDDLEGYGHVAAHIFELLASDYDERAGH